MSAGRTIKLVCLAVATAVLAGGAWLAQGGLKRLGQARQEAAQVQRALQQARSLLPEVQQREQLVRSLAEVSRQVESMGFDPAHWGERRLRRAQGPATRAEAAQVLGELGRGGAGQIFVADLFDVGTTAPGAGLFHSPEPGDEGLVLGVNGTLHFKTVSTAPTAR